MEKPKSQMIEEKIIDGSFDQLKIPSEKQADLLIEQAVKDTGEAIKIKKEKGAK